jgi:hypothetical protein
MAIDKPDLKVKWLVNEDWLNPRVVTETGKVVAENAPVWLLEHLVTLHNAYRDAGYSPQLKIQKDEVVAKIEDIKILIDLVDQGDTIASGFLDTEEVITVRKMAHLVGVNPADVTPSGMIASFPHEFKPDNTIHYWDTVNNVRSDATTFFTERRARQNGDADGPWRVVAIEAPSKICELCSRDMMYHNSIKEPQLEAPNES